MTKLGDELRKRFRSPREALKALGLDEGLLETAKESLMTTRPTRLAARAMLITHKAVAPLLAMDAAVPLLPIFAELSTKNFTAKGVTAKVREAIKGKTIARDADLSHLEAALKGEEDKGNAEPKVADESVSEPQHKAMMAAAEGKSNLGIPQNVGKEFKEADKGKTFDGPSGNLGEYLRSKGHGDAVVKDAEEFMLHHAVEHPGTGADAEESEEERKAREAAEAKKKAEDEEMAKREEEAKGMDAALKTRPTKQDMEQAIQVAVKAERKRGAELVDALSEVRPYVGELAMTFDSAEDVYRKALELLGVDEAKTIHASALPTILRLQRKVGARNDNGSPRIATDSANRDDFDKMFPDAGRINRVA